MFSRRHVLAGAGALSMSSLAVSGQAQASAQAPAQPLKPYELADFFKPERTRDAALSPGGERIAVLHAVGEGDKRQVAFDLFEAADPGKALRRIPLGSHDAHTVEWATDERLLVWVDYPWDTVRGPTTGSRMGGGKITGTVRRVMAVNLDGSNPVVMFDDSMMLRTNFNLSYVVDLLPDDPDHILMLAWDYRAEAIALFKVNTNTGKAEVLEKGRSRTVGWTIEKGVPILRYDWNPRGTIESVYARAPGEGDWKLLRKTHIEQQPEFFYVGPTADPMVILAGAREGDGALAVRELDLRTLAFGKTVSQRPGLDVVGGLVDERRRYIGAKYFEDRIAYDFVDPVMGKHFAGMNAFLGHECNVDLYDVDGAQNRFLASVSGPREPGGFFFYDKVARRLEHLGSKHPALQLERLASARPVKVRTRDGATLSAYLTAPVTGAPGPLVVLPHGGPEARDVLGWNRQVQVLAAQGWWVLQPNFRGSGGYGLAFAKAGWRRWGDRMQEDIEDAVAQVLAEHKLDANRVAIMGTSYGGYAALMGAVRRPDLYKAAIAICGVSDLPDMLNFERAEDDTPDKEIYRFWVDRIGDPAADAAALAAASPRRRAAEVKCPVLLVHGLDDQIVPVKQSRMMLTALKSAGKTVEFVEVPGAGHSDWDDDVEKDLMTRYVAMLGKAFAA